MKIVCDACQAKYSIADEKVQGKAFKIRCKKCGHIIVVRTGADRPAAAPEAKPAAAADQQGVWYIVVEGEQVGPLAESDIAGRLSRGEINPDTLIWKDGLADWVKISTVPELSNAVAAQAPAAAPAEPPAEETPPPAAPIPARRRSSARMQTAKEPARSEAPAEDVFAKPAALSPASVDLFAPSMAVPSQASEPATTPFAFGATAAPSPDPAPQQAPAPSGGGQNLTGQRNENSVLFSLSNLEALAVPSSTSARPPSTTSTSEGSGLIDIRSMAARTIGQTSKSETTNAVDSLPTFSTPQFSPVAPVLLPLAPSGPPKWVYPVLGVLGLGIVALGVGIYKVVSAPPPAPPPQIIVPAPAAPVAAPAPAAAPAAPTAPTAAAPEGAKPAAPEEKATEDKAAADKKKSSGKGGKVASKGSEGSAKQASDKKSAAAEPAPAPAPAPAAAKPAKKGGSIEDLLDQVGPKKPAGEAKAAKAPSSAPLPPLSQSDIVNAMKGVQPRVKECFNQYKQAGIANVSISVTKGGRVGSATVSGKFAGTPSGSCVEAAAKTAKFPPCEAMSFPWPFQLH
jgi:predicted Zn finger-like uncharacterized protein